MKQYTVRIQFQFGFSPYESWIEEREVLAGNVDSAVALAVAKVSPQAQKWIEGATGEAR